MLFESMFHYRRVSLIFWICLFPFFTLAQSNSRKEHQAQIAQWQSLMPQIQAELKRRKMSCVDEWTPGIYDAADVTGDGIPEALIDWCNGGASTDWLVLMRLDHDRPVEARFLAPKGKTPDLFEGASVTHTKSVEFDPASRAVYTIAYDFDGIDQQTQLQKLAHCKVYAYVWNDKTKTFDWNTVLSKRRTTTYCAEIRRQWSRR